MYRPGIKQPLPTGLIAQVLAWAAFVSWISWGALLMGWVNGRPRHPNPANGAVIPFQDHGVIFVTQRDLDMSRTLLALAIWLLLLSALAGYLHRRQKQRAGDRSTSQ